MNNEIVDEAYVLKNVILFHSQLWGQADEQLAEQIYDDLRHGDECNTSNLGKASILSILGLVGKCVVKMHYFSKKKKSITSLRSGDLILVCGGASDFIQGFLLSPYSHIGLIVKHKTTLLLHSTPGSEKNDEDFVEYFHSEKERNSRIFCVPIKAEIETAKEVLFSPNIRKACYPSDNQLMWENLVPSCFNNSSIKDKLSCGNFVHRVLRELSLVSDRTTNITPPFFNPKHAYFKQSLCSIFESEIYELEDNLDV